MSHPLASLSPARQMTLFKILIALTLMLMLIFFWLGAPLTTSAAPQGIVSFELAGSPANIRLILSSWDPSAQLRLAFIQGLDFLFLLLYSTAIASGCLIASRVLSRLKWPLSSLGFLFAWALWLAAVLDIIENTALLVILFGVNSSPYPEIARLCALLKFGLIFLGMTYIFYAAAARFASALAPKSNT